MLRYKDLESSEGSCAVLPINEGFEKNNNNSCFFLNASAANRNTDV
jgi:hypothetical protein